MSSIWQNDVSKIDSITNAVFVVCNNVNVIVVTFVVDVVIVVSVCEECSIVVTKGWIVTGLDWLIP